MIALQHAYLLIQSELLKYGKLRPELSEEEKKTKAEVSVGTQHPLDSLLLKGVWLKILKKRSTVNSIFMEKFLGLHRVMI